MKIEMVNSNRPTSELIMEKKLTSRSKSPISSASSFRTSNSLYSSSMKSSASNMAHTSPKHSSNTKTFANTLAQTQITPKDSLSNRFKAVLSNKEASESLHMHDTKKNDYSSKISVDASIIHQVLFNKKQNNPARPVTFTVKL